MHFWRPQRPCGIPPYDTIPMVRCKQTWFATLKPRLVPALARLKAGKSLYALKTRVVFSLNGWKIEKSKAEIFDHNVYQKPCVKHLPPFVCLSHPFEELLRRFGLRSKKAGNVHSAMLIRFPFFLLKLQGKTNVGNLAPQNAPESTTVKETIVRIKFFSFSFFFFCYQRKPFSKTVWCGGLNKKRALMTIFFA